MYLKASIKLKTIERLFWGFAIVGTGTLLGIALAAVTVGAK